MNEIKSFSTYREYHDLITLLDEKDQPKLCHSIFMYMFEDKEPKDLNTKQQKAWNNLIKPLYKSKMKSKATSKQNQNEYQNDNQKEIKTDVKKGMTSNDVNVKCNMSLEKEIIRERTFKKPTVEEIENYCTERNNNVDANNFYDFYESKGWKVGNQSMKDWKACIRTWEKKKFTKQVPEWFDKEIESNQSEKVKEILEEFK